MTALHRYAGPAIVAILFVAGVRMAGAASVDGSSWREQIPALTGTYRVLTLDLPGHGKSGRLESSKFSMDLLPVPGLFADRSALGNPAVTRTIFTNYEHHEIPGTGHFLMMEKPREFNARLAAFLDELPK
jgi:pimeloyl-ACP methyl ester carboxylesterase